MSNATQMWVLPMWMLPFDWFTLDQAELFEQSSIGLDIEEGCFTCLHSVEWLKNEWFDFGARYRKQNKLKADKTEKIMALRWKREY